MNTAQMTEAVLLEVQSGTHPLLARFIATAAPHEVVALVTDQLLQRLIACWPTVPVEWTPPDTVPDNATAATLWRFLWSSAVVDLEALAAALGCEEDHAQRKLLQAVGARLVYPDGRIHQYAAGALRAEVAKLLPRQQQQQRGGRQ